MPECLTKEFVFYLTKGFGVGHVVWHDKKIQVFIRKLSSGSGHTREFINRRQENYLRCYCCRPHMKNSEMRGSLDIS